MKKVIWAILSTNMGHITDQYGPYWEPPSVPPWGEELLKGASLQWGNRRSRFACRRMRLGVGALVQADMLSACMEYEDILSDKRRGAHPSPPKGREPERGSVFSHL